MKTRYFFQTLLIAAIFLTACDKQLDLAGNNGHIDHPKTI